MPELASTSTCTGCMGCVNICPKNAISPFSQPDGHTSVRIDPEKCVDCNLCEKACSIVNEYSYACNTLDSDFYAGWSTERTIRKNGATSGIFGSLAKAVLESGGYVAGAVMEGTKCRYIVSSDRQDIARLQGSKYTASYPGHVFKQIRTLLNEGNKVLFCGLPCHTAALLNVVPANLQANLLTADIICGGVSSPMLIERFAMEHPSFKSIVSFRNKENGWQPSGYRYNLKYLDSEGKTISSPEGKRNLVTDGFACELTDRQSCYDCRYAGIHRKSDMTLGDLWGDSMFPNQHFNGVSAIIVHTEKGERLLRSSEVELHSVPASSILLHNSRLFNGKSIKKYFPERRLFSKLIRNLSYPSLLKVYASDLRHSGVLWLPFALYRLVSFRIAEKIRQKQDRSIIKTLSEDKQER